MIESASVRHTARAALCIAALAAAAPGFAQDKPALFGNPNVLFQMQRPQFGTPAQVPTIPEQRTRPIQTSPNLSVPSTHIGLLNPTTSDVAAVVDFGNNQKKVVLLHAHQFETIDCRACTAPVTLTVPRGATPAAGDFSMPVRPGAIYQFTYDDKASRWIVTPQ